MQQNQIFIVLKLYIVNRVQLMWITGKITGHWDYAVSRKAGNVWLKMFECARLQKQSLAKPHVPLSFPFDQKEWTNTIVWEESKGDKLVQHNIEIALLLKCKKLYKQ